MTDDTAGKKYPLADYGLTPHMPIAALDFVMNLPPAR